MISFVSEIQLKRGELYAISELKEKCFYEFLTIGKAKDLSVNGLSRIDDICYSVFSKSGRNIKGIIEEELNRQSLKGMHITNNVLSIIAICLYESSYKEKYLLPFFMKTSLENRIIINHIFPEYTLSPNENIITDYEKAISEIMNGNIDKELKLYCGLQNTDGLIELFIIEKLYQQYMFDQPIGKLTPSLIQIKNEIYKFHHRIVFSIKLIYWVFFVIIVPLFGYYLFNYLYDNYEKHNISKLLAIIPIVLIVLGITRSFLKKNSVLVRDFYEKIENYAIRAAYFIIGINYKLIQEIILKPDSELNIMLANHSLYRHNPETPNAKN